MSASCSSGWVGVSIIIMTGSDRSHGLLAVSRVCQHIKLSDVSLGTRPRYRLVVDEDVKKPNKQTKPHGLWTRKRYSGFSRPLHGHLGLRIGSGVSCVAKKVEQSARITSEMKHTQEPFLALGNFTKDWIYE